METETNSAPPARKRFLTRKRLVVSLSFVISAIVLFGILGYFWLPGFAKTKLEQVLSETLERPVTVQAIEIKPFTLEVAIQGFRISEKATDSHQNPFISFDQLYVDLSAESLFHLAPIVTTISLTAPRIYLTREDKNQFNFSDLIEKFGKPSEDKPDNQKNKQTLFSINSISIQNGEITFIDHVKNSRQQITAIQLAIPFIANFKNVLSNWVEPNLSARIDDAPFELSGKLLPFADKQEATLSLKLNDIDLTNIDEYSPIPLGIRLLSEKFNSDLSVNFTHTAGESPNIDLSGRAALKAVTIQDNQVEMPYRIGVEHFELNLNKVSFNEAAPIIVGTTVKAITITPLEGKQTALFIPKLELETITVDRAQRKIDLGAIILDEIKGLVKRQSDGQLEFNRMFAQTSSLEQTEIEEKPVSSVNQPLQRLIVS